MKVSEKEIAKIVIDHFESLGFETYKEVTERGGRPRADIIAVKDDKYIVIECKTSMNLKLMEQAYYWTDKSHETYICIPITKRSTRSKFFAYNMCRDYGIGVLEVYPKTNSLVERVKSSTTKNPDLPKLYEQQKSSVAGVSSGDFVTPFKITCGKLVDYVKENGPVMLKTAVENIEHHYASNNSAKNSLHKMINIGVISELEIYRESRKIMVRIS